MTRRLRRFSPRHAALCVVIASSLAACGGGPATVQNALPSGDGASPAPSVTPTTPSTPVAQNNAPTITGTPPAAVTAGTAFTFTPSAKDPDGDTLTFAISGKPGWASFNTQTGRLTGTPTNPDSGSYPNISITVSDGKASVALSSFSVAVTSTTAVGRATMSWSPPLANTDGSTLQDLSGFRIYFGSSAGSLEHSVDVTNPSISSYTIENLTSGVWYFAVRAFNRDGVESDLSNVGTKTIS